MLLEARSLDVVYGDIPAIWSVSLSVDKGEIVSIVGPNGAGKSTLVNAIAGLLGLVGGSLTIDGVSLTNVPAHRFCNHGIALVPEGRRLFTRMTVDENLALGAYRPDARRLASVTRENVLRLFPILRDRGRQIAGTMSGGQQQMLAIARALMARPKIILMDEPSLGLAPSIVDDLFKIIQEINRSGTGVLLIEQNVEQALAIAHRAYILEQGRIVLEGSPLQLLADPRIREAYLGM